MKHLFLIVAMAFFTIPSLAQISFGLESGVISSLKTNQEFKNENRRNAVSLGINLSYQLNQSFSLTSGLHYLQQGYQNETCYQFSEGIKNELRRKTDYIMVPLLANIHLGKKKRFTTSFGIYGAYNLKATQEHPTPFGGCAIYYEPDLKHITYDFHAGAIAGLSYTILNIDNFKVDSNFKYYTSLGGIDDYGNNQSFLMTISVNYLLGL